MKCDRPRVFLTGASTGIGLETAKLLTQNGYEVWGSSRSLARLPQLEHFHPVVLDLSDPVSVEHAFSQVIQEAGRLDVLINNAGCGHFGSFEGVSEALWREQMQILLHAPLQLTRLALAVMKKQEKGTILNISSLAVRFPIPFMAPYNTAKAGLSAATHSLRLELGQKTPIRVIDLQPGDICTPFHDAMTRQSADSNSIPAYHPRMERAYQVIEKNMRSAPPPRLVAQKILKILGSSSQRSTYTVGDFFQTNLAPWAQRLLPRSWIERATRMYYGLD